MTPLTRSLPDAITVGADPEFFVKRNGHIIPGHEIPIGSKQTPSQTKHGFIQVDGLAVECNVRPSRSRGDFIQNIHGVMADLREAVQAWDKNTDLVATPSHFFGKTRLADLPEEARRLGCDPDFSAYTGAENPRPDENSEYRTASGHIHIGWTNTGNARSVMHMQRCIRFTRVLDFYLGMPSLFWDKDNTRRNLYGKAGAFRPKPYGVEYRVLSNAWLSSAALAGFVFDQTQKAWDAFRKGEDLQKEFMINPETVINGGHYNWGTNYPHLYDRVMK